MKSEAVLNPSLAADLEQADEESIRRILRKVEILGQKIDGKAGDERERRRRRSNEEGNRLISGFGDPRLVERWRIHRLVEERANAVEKEVAEQVKREMEERRRERSEGERVRPPRSAKELLMRVEKLKREIKEELDMNVGVVKTIPTLKMKQVSPMKKVLPVKKVLPMKKVPTARQVPQTKQIPQSRQVPQMKQASQTRQVSQVHWTEEPKSNVEPYMTTDAFSKCVMSPSKQPARRKDTIVKNNSSEGNELLKISHPSPNVALFITKQRPMPRNPIIHLSGHVLQGVDIAPSAPNLQTSSTVIIVEDDPKVKLEREKNSTCESIKSPVAFDDELIPLVNPEKQIKDVTLTSAIVEDVVKIVQATDLVKEKPTESEEKIESSENYSDSFEESSNNGEDIDALKESNSEEEEDEEDLNTVYSPGSGITDRLSTIPEDPAESKSTLDSDTIIVDVVAEQLNPPIPVVPVPVNEDTELLISEVSLSESSLTISVKKMAVAENTIDEISSSKPESIIIKTVLANEKEPSIAEVKVEAREKQIELEKQPDVQIDIIKPPTEAVVTKVTTETQTLDQTTSSKRDNTALSDTSQVIESESSLSSERILSSSQEEATDLSDGQVLFCGKGQLSEGELSIRGESRYSGYFGDLSSDSGDLERGPLRVRSITNHKGPRINLNVSKGSSSELSDTSGDLEAIRLKPVFHREDQESDGEWKITLPNT